jgi:ribosomal protein S18 acetylase RimI-like enzyme
MALSITPARTTDLDRLVAVEGAAFDPALYLLMSRRQFAAHLASPRALILVARDSGAGAVGYALCFRRRGTGWLRLYSLAVDPAFQGGRVGAELFRAVEDAARREGLGVQLEIRADNRKLLDRYLGLGYSRYRDVADYYPDGAGCIKLKREMSAM